MAEKAKKTTKAKKTKQPSSTVKSSVVGKKKTWDKPGVGKIICLVVVVISILVIIIATMLSGAPISNNYFVSDGNKYVLNIPADEEDEELVSTHVVYFYKGDEITGAKIYYEFVNAEIAKTAYDELVESLTEEEEAEVNDYKLEGKYVIITADESTYADLKASDVKSQIESYEALQNGELLEDSEELEESETTENSEE